MMKGFLMFWEFIRNEDTVIIQWCIFHSLYLSLIIPCYFLVMGALRQCLGVLTVFSLSWSCLGLDCYCLGLDS